MVTYAKILPKIVNPRDIAGNTEEQEQEETRTKQNNFENSESGDGQLGLVVPVYVFALGG